MVVRQQESRYRVFYPEGEADSLPPGVSIIKQYPAFGIVSTTPEIADELRRRYPVEEVAAPKPVPLVPDVAGIDRVLKDKRRAPYALVIRFELPPDPGWSEAVAKAGCRVLDPLGRLTVVVSCPNKKCAAKLQELPNVARVSAYVPDIQLSPDSVGVAQAEENRPRDPVAFGTEPDRPHADASGDQVVPGSFIATFFTLDEAQRADRSLRRSGIRRITEVGDKSLVINLLDSDDPQRDLQLVAQRTGLRSLQNQYLEQLHNDVARMIIAERVADSGPHSLGLTGRGEIVAVADSGLDNGKIATDHPDFRGRISHLESFPVKRSLSKLVSNPRGDDGAADDVSGHGTHVAGSIAGSGAAAQSFGQPPIQGGAPDAQLVFQATQQHAVWTRESARKSALNGDCTKPIGLWGIPDDLRVLFRAAHAQGARIHSNSWGGGKAGEYSKRCSQVDDFVWNHRDFLVLCSASNNGTDKKPVGGGIDERSVRPPGTAKNCLTVGASENDRPGEAQTWGQAAPSRFSAEPFKSDRVADSVDDIAPFSGRGPCKTGRRKPDVVAPGTRVLSARSQTLPRNPKHKDTWKQYYWAKSGTSMATPLVAGSAALVRQYLREERGLEQPTAALVKAVLIHSAQYIHYRFARKDSAPWADNEQGWGRVSLRHVLNPDPPLQVHFIDHTECVPVQDYREFAFTVADPAVPLRITLVYTDYPGRELINNLNLYAYAPDGSYVLGNDFAGAGRLDKVNNVEGIVVTQPQVGNWIVKVVFSDSASADAGTQDFALVASGGGMERI